MDRSIGFFGLTFLIFLVAGIAFAPSESNKVEQPFPFNHAAHSSKTECWDCHFRCEENRDEDGDVDCEDCEDADGPFCSEHMLCGDHKLPGLPGIQVCIGCHEYDLLDLKTTPASADEEANIKAQRKLLEWVEFDEYDEVANLKPLEWQRVTRLSGSCIYFSHRTHTLVGEIACEECHGDVSSLTSPPEVPVVELGMNWCIDCHQQRDVTEDCMACHR